MLDFKLLTNDRKCLEELYNFAAFPKSYRNFKPDFMRNGFIYVVIKFVIDKLCLLNLVEYFKKAGKWLNSDKNNKDSESTYIRVATDIFIVFKWIFVLILWAFSITSLWAVIAVWYLIVSNIYTYFFHHIWTDEALNMTKVTEDRIRRRFINLLLAVAYSDVCFAYLYRYPYFNYLEPSDKITSLHAIWFSISNAFAANYDVIKPMTDLGNTTAMIQLIITFIFISIILSRSVPQKS